MARITKKFLAQKLRQKGLSIAEIAKKLDMQKSGTISKWCRDISLTSNQIKNLAKKQKTGSYKGRMIFLEKIRKIRMEETARLRKVGIKEVGMISKRDLFISGISMYWSEGYTHTSNEQVGFVNSDPRMILLMLKWFNKICNISNENFSLAIRINEIHEKRVGKIENYWSKITGIPLSQFTKTILIKVKSKKIYPNHDDYYGTLRITIKRGTSLRRKITGWIDGLAEQKQFKI